MDHYYYGGKERRLQGRTRKMGRHEDTLEGWAAVVSGDVGKEVRAPAKGGALHILQGVALRVRSVSGGGDGGLPPGEDSMGAYVRRAGIASYNLAAFGDVSQALYAPVSGLWGGDDDTVIVSIDGNGRRISAVSWKGLCSHYGRTAALHQLTLWSEAVESNCCGRCHVPHHRVCPGQKVPVLQESILDEAVKIKLINTSPWASCLTSLNLTFLICKMGDYSSTYLRRFWHHIRKCMQVM